MGTATIEVDGAAGNRVTICSRREGSGNANRTDRCKRSRSGRTASQVIVIECRDGLGTASIKVNGAAGNGIAIASRSKSPCDPNRPVRCERSCTGRTANQVVVIEGGDSLRTAAIEVDGTASDGIAIASRSEVSSDSNRTARCKRS